MGREIEMKIPLSDEEYERLMKFAQEQEEKPVHICKKDEYFSKYDSEEERRAACKALKEPKVIRIRTEGESLDQKKSYFGIKFKTIEGGVEFNEEDETFVEDETVIRRFLEISGFKKYFEKHKDSNALYCRSKADKDVLIHLELVIVNGHKYIETEVTDASQEPQRVRKALESFLTELGLDISKKDSRSWMEIIGSDS